MPKGTRGCFNCGKPTRFVIQVTLRDILGWNARPRERKADSAQRAYCAACVPAAYGDIARKLRRRIGGVGAAARGCAWCGASPTVCRIQLWIREIVDGTQRSANPTITSSFCSGCRDRAYAAATIYPMEGDTLREAESDAYKGMTFEGTSAQRRPVAR